MESELKFPPEALVPYSVRLGQLQTVKFLALRKALTEEYRNLDGTPLMTYQETLEDRTKVRTKLLEYELSHGWLTDDRTTAQVIQHPAATNGVPVSQNVPPTAPVVEAAPPYVPKQAAVPVIGFQQPSQAPQQVASPAQAIAAAQMPLPLAMPQEPPHTNGNGSGYKRPAPKLATSVAPPPAVPAQSAVAFIPTMQQVPAIAPPSVSVGVQTSHTIPVPAPIVLQAPVLSAPVVQAISPPQMSVAPTDLKPVISKIDEIGKGLTLISDELDKQKLDFKTVVGSLSGQTNETNKAITDINKSLSELRSTVDLLSVAIHHMFLVSPAAAGTKGEANDIVSFKKYLSRYLPHPQ